jgi:hypothetical protein
MPEAVDFRSRLFAEEDWRDAVFGDDFKAPGRADDPNERPHHARNHSQQKALDEGESQMGFGGHSFDFSF